MEERNKTIWIINQYASHLVTRHEELAKSFASHGYNVAIVTSSFHHGKREYLYDDPIVFSELSKNVTYVYLHSGPSYQNNGVGRIINMLDFCRLVGKHKKSISNKLGKPGYIIASSAPPFVWEAGYRVAKKYHAKFIAEFRDIWPMSLVDVQGVSPKHPLVRVLERIEKRAYKRADAVVSTMPYAWKHVIEVSKVPREKVYWMANGINVKEAEEDLLSEKKLPEDLNDYLSKHWCCVYVGSIVKSECLEYILNGFNKVKDKEIYFAIVGDGHEKERIRSKAEELQLTNLRFFSAIDKHLIPKTLNLAGAVVAAHEELPIYQYGLSMNKLNDYLASGKPTIFACEVPNIVKEAGHFSIPMDNAQELADTIEKVKQLSEDELKSLRESAISIIRKDYDYPEIGKKYISMMESL